MLEGISSITVPSALPFAVRLVVLTPLLLAAALAWRRGSRAAVTVLTTAAVVYTFAVAVAALRTVVDPIDTRLMSPVLAPLAVLVALGVSSPRVSVERTLRAVALALVAAMLVVSPGIVWRGHELERSLSNIPEDVTCADWPARYSGAAIGVTPNRR